MFRIFNIDLGEGGKTFFKGSNVVGFFKYICVRHQYRGGTSSLRWRAGSMSLSHHQYRCVTSLVQRRVCSADLSHHQHGGGCAVRTCHIINTVEGICAVRISHIINTDEGVQYGSVTSSVRTRVCSTGLPKLLRGSWWLYLYQGKMIFYGQFCFNLNLVLPWLYPDVAVIPL